MRKIEEVFIDGVCLTDILEKHKKWAEDKQEENEEREDILFEIESLINQLNNEFNKLKKLI